MRPDINFMSPCSAGLLRQVENRFRNRIGRDEGLGGTVLLAGTEPRSVDLPIYDNMDHVNALRLKFPG